MAHGRGHALAGCSAGGCTLCTSLARKGGQLFIRDVLLQALAAAAQHALAHIVLEGQGAHRQLLGVLLHALMRFGLQHRFGAHRCGLRRTHRPAGGLGRLGYGTQRAGFFCFTRLNGGTQAGAGLLTGIQTLQALFRRGHHLHTMGGGTVGQDQSAFTKDRPRLG